MLDTVEVLYGLQFGVAIFLAGGHRTILSQRQIQDLERRGFVRGSDGTNALS